METIKPRFSALLFPVYVTDLTGVFPAMICYLLGVRGLLGVVLVVGFLFVLHCPIKKPGLKTTLTMIGVSVTIVAIIFVCTQL